MNLAGCYVQHESGGTYCALFAPNGEILLAGGVAEPDPRDLEETLAHLFEHHEMGEVGPASVGMWLNREYDEGRAGPIAAHFEVSV